MDTLLDDKTGIVADPFVRGWPSDIGSAVPLVFRHRNWSSKYITLPDPNINTLEGKKIPGRFWSSSLPPSQRQRAQGLVRKVSPSATVDSMLQMRGRWAYGTYLLLNKTVSFSWMTVLQSRQCLLRRIEKWTDPRLESALISINSQILGVRYRSSLLCYWWFHHKAFCMLLKGQNGSSVPVCT